VKTLETPTTVETAPPVERVERVEAVTTTTAPGRAGAPVGATPTPGGGGRAVTWWSG
jgi:hypothetical protein